MFYILQLLVGEITYAVLFCVARSTLIFSLIPEKLLSAFSKKVQDCRHCACLYMLIKSEKIFFI